MDSYSINATADSKFVYEEALRMKSANESTIKSNTATDLKDKAELNKGR